MPVAVRVDSDELYAALRTAGVDEAQARRAAQSVVSVAVLDQLVTKADLEVALAAQTAALTAALTEQTRRWGTLVLATVGLATTVLGLLIALAGWG